MNFMWPSCSDVKMSKCDVSADLLFCFVNFMLLFDAVAIVVATAPHFDLKGHVQFHDIWKNPKWICIIIVKLLWNLLWTIISAMKRSSLNEDMEINEYFHLLFENSMRLIKLLWFQLESLLYLDYIFVLFFLFHLNGVRNDCV